MPQRGMTIDPMRPLDEQVISTSIQMPVAWLKVFQAKAKENNLSFAAYMRTVLREFAAANDVDLLPYHR